MVPTSRKSSPKASWTLAEWLTYQEQLHRRRVDLGLDRIYRVFRRLLPNYKPPVTFTIGGTNGKGSSVAFLEAILRAAGCRVGAYTSPHLLRYNERIRLNGEPVGNELLCEAFARVERAREGEPLSFFEFGTLTALDLFSRLGVEVQILEVGLGGRLDAVNIIDPNVALITTIGLDHQQWLGQTREEIALEKAGILRRGKPAVIGDLDPPITLLRFIEENQIPASLARHDFHHSLEDKGWRWWNRECFLENLPPPSLAGRHQYQNCSAVLELLFQARSLVSVPEAALRKGIRSAKLPGRYQWLSGRPDILLDVAHNEQATKALARYLEERVPKRRIIALFSILADKEIEAVVAPLIPRVDLWVVTQLDSPRAASLEEIISALRGQGALAIVSERDVLSACQKALGACCPEDLLLVFGSFLIVADFLRQRLQR